MPIASAEDAQDCAARINETIARWRYIESEKAKLAGAEVGPISITPATGQVFTYDPEARDDPILLAVYNNMLAEQAALIATLKADAGEMNSFAQAL